MHPLLGVHRAGALPFAAHAAHADGIEVLDLAWGQLTPVHWHVGRDEILLTDPDALQLEEAESRALLEAVRELFESEGFALAWGAPLRWYAAHESFAELPTAALDRVIGRNVDRWLPGRSGASAARETSRLVRRLQNEVQMVLYASPARHDALRQVLPVFAALPGVQVVIRDSEDKGNVRLWQIVDGIELFTRPGCFQQGNSAQADVIRNLIGGRISAKETKVLFDLYSGSGNYSLPFARRVQRIFGCDENAAGIDVARFAKLTNRLGGLSAAFDIGFLEFRNEGLQVVVSLA